MSENLNLFEIADGPHSHRGAVATSAEAAAELAPRIGRLQRECLRALRRRPMTADEVAERTGMSPLCSRPRCAELRDAGLIRDTGERRANASGKRAAVWEPTSAGMEVLRG